MKKPHDLRAVLTTALDPRHHISEEPGRLLMAAVNCRPATTPRQGFGFEYNYTLQISLMDFAGDPVEVIVPLLFWIRRHQRDLLTPKPVGQGQMDMSFEFLDVGKYDIHIDLPLSEGVKLELRQDGGHDVVFLDEPIPFGFDEETAEPLHAVYLDGEIILHCDAHPGAGLD